MYIYLHGFFKFNAYSNDRFESLFFDIRIEMSIAKTSWTNDVQI